MPHRFLDPTALVRLGGMEFVARLVVEGFITGMHRSPYQGFNVEFAEHRQYMPGDDLRRVDWRVYGKSDRFYIKRYEEETNLRAYLVVDASRSMTYSRDRGSKLEYTCYVAASLAYLMLRQRDSVGIATVDDRVRVYIPPRATPAHMSAMLSALESIDPGADTDLGLALHELSARLVKRGLIVLLSDLLTDPDSTLKALRLLRHMKHEVVVFHILDESERTFPFTQPTIFRDVESGETLATNPRVLKASYLEALNQFVATYRDGCRAHGIDYVLMDTSTPFDFALSTYLSHRK
ncbi:DUF58 domain-containing protein [Candidatus Poribacteria bacterium]|nr:DUF58 domain-containing protein [Candidatus Poribacteria bacterium]